MSRRRAQQTVECGAPSPTSPIAVAPAPLPQLTQNGRVLAGGQGLEEAGWAQGGLGKRPGDGPMGVHPSMKVFASHINNHQSPLSTQLFSAFSRLDALWRRRVFSVDRSPDRLRGAGRASLL